MRPKIGTSKQYDFEPEI